jgi:hypothetical protein
VASPGKALRSAARRAGFDLIRRHYYSPIPDLGALPPETWSRESSVPGVDLDADSSLEFVRRELTGHMSEYDPPRESTGNPRDFYLDNGLYESGDAELLYAMMRRFAPRTVIELGSGMSTLVIADALKANGGETGHLACDPFPRKDLRTALGQVAELRPISATEVPLSEFEALRDGDVLFVDTTHVVKIGSEVNRIILEVLPALASGVIVHVHDIYLPWEYPREFIDERNFFWNEQYLLQAFLAFNSRFEVLFGTHALARRYPDELAGLLPSGALGRHPSSLWMRRID